MAVNLPPSTKYGLNWPAGIHPVQIPLSCIQRGGQWVEDGWKQGAPLFELYRDVQSILWPDDDHHEWSDLILKTILDERITIVQGSKDSSKTHSMAKYALVDYFAFPRNTLILMSSTDLRGLELRVWGDVKDLYNRAKEVWPEVPGFVLESKYGIFTDGQVEEGQARDIRRGLCCFPTGTFVDTPTGPRPIEGMRVGDEVNSACGVGRVSEVHSRRANQLVRVHLSDGRHVDCTEKHPFFTHRGWVKALDLVTSDRVISAHEALCFVRGTNRTRLSEPQVLLDTMSRIRAAKNLRALREHVPAIEIHGERSYGSILFDDLCKSLGGCSWSVLEASHAKVPALWEGHAQCTSHSSCLFAEMPRPSFAGDVQRVRSEFPFSPTCDNEAENIFLQQVLQMEMDQSSNRKTRFQRDSDREVASGTLPRSAITVSFLHRKDLRSKCETPIRDGPCVSGSPIERRTRRWHSQHENQEPSRSGTHRRTSQTSVDCVEILEPRGDSRFEASEGGYLVHNLEIAGHPSYSVNGVLVHNCIPVMDSEGKWTGMRRWVGVKQKRRRVLADELQFYPSAYLPTLANLNKGNFKFVGVGNPIGEADPLDKLGEPKNGWDNLPEITETTTWKNTMGGTTIQLLGSDSPAIKHPGQYEYLIDQSDIDYIVNFWGTDTAEYWNQGMGIRRPGINAHRVLTREAARKFGALDKVVWGPKPPIGIYAIDASYGGDRCAGCRGELGWDINGKQVLAISEPEVIPIRVFPKGTPENQKKLAEDQIAEFVKARCFESDIPPRNVFHDATGRGSVGTAFARIWSADTNPIEFGVKPTERPVQNDMFIYDHEKRERRLTRCDEHYSKFVTELWFSFAYAVEARQIRTLPNSVLDELCAREWGTVRGGKKEVEAKEFTKKRLGRSPDFADAAVIVLEGARRLGFTINKMEGPKQMRQEDDRWKNALRQRVATTRKSYTLNYAV